MTVATTASPRSVRRRTLVRGAAWTVPVVAVAAPAPAFAASCTTQYAGSLDWATQFTRNSDGSGGTGTMTFDNGRTSTVTVGSTVTNYTRGGSNTAFTNFGTTNPVGGTGQAGLTIYQTPNGAGTAANPYRTGDRASNQIITLAFNPAVLSLSFLLTDIDSATGDFIDAVEVSGATYTSSTAAGSVGGTSTVSGAGTQASPFTQTNANQPYDNNTSPGGNVRLTFSGSVTSVSIRYWNNIAPGSVAANTNPDQALFLSRMTAAILNVGC